MGLTLRVRHYWSRRNNVIYYNLQPNGSLVQRIPSEFNASNDEDFNTFNVDMVYLWECAPGSELSVAYKNSSLTDVYPGEPGYYHNLNNTFSQPANNNFSIKVQYYIDYQSLKKKKGSS